VPARASIAQLASVSVPMLFKEAVDAVSAVATNPAVAAPVGILLGYGAARAASGLFGEARSAVFSTVAHSAIRKMSVQVFEHLHNLDHHFHLTRQTGALSRAIDRGSRGINFVLTSMLFNIFPTALELAMVSALLVHQCGWSYAGVTVGTIGVYTWFTLAVTSKRVAIRKEMNQKDNEANNRVIDSLINFETVKYFNNEKLEVQRYDESLRGYERAAVKTAESLAWLNFGQGAIFTAGMTAMMIMAAHDITAGLMSVGSLVMVNGLLFQMSFPLHFLGTVYREMRQSLIDMELMFRLTSNKPSVTDHAASVDLPADKPYTIEFDDVHFRYDDERAILNGVTFTVPAGKTVAIVGPSGCGKSTIMRLVYRFYDVDQGAIRVNGVDVRDIRVASLRSRIGVVPQDTVLFNNTIFYNIAYGDPSAPRSDVVAAAAAAQIGKVIESFPGGYDTPVGERGLMMSGTPCARASACACVRGCACVRALARASVPR
jgi:ABC-type transport system involved in Fe-S cluster assembly fused permease/ATPase subunit